LAHTTVRLPQPSPLSLLLLRRCSLLKLVVAFSSLLSSQ